MAEARKARNTDYYKDVQEPRGRRKQRSAHAKHQAQQDFQDKKFDDLTPPEKDELLKALAISLGIVTE